MARRGLTLVLLIVPALGLGALGLALVAAAPAHGGAAGVGAADHFTWRQGIGLLLAIGLGAITARLGSARLLAAAPALFAVALAVTVAVFVPRVGVLAAGAHRWVHLGPISGSPSPFLAGAVALWVAGAEARAWPQVVVLGGVLAAVLVLALQPDFSAAATTLLVAFATLSATGRMAPGRLIPAAALLLAVLAAGALRSGYVDNRIRGFLSPESDRRGKGFEVLALAHANAAAGSGAAGLGHGHARRRLSSPASDYAFALVGEELGRPGAFGVLGAWLAIGGGVLVVATRAGRRQDAPGRALASGLGTALLVPAALHIAVCRGWLPIIGVTMPLLSYDPALTVTSGAELGMLVAIALERRGLA